MKIIVTTSQANENCWRAFLKLTCSSVLQVANMRHNALFRRFISALTRGGPGGMPRPIEVHAHDPLRYVGDMLGWLHQVRLALSITCLCIYLVGCCDFDLLVYSEV